MPPDPRPSLTPPQVAERYGVGADKVLRWIASGELRAVNVATSPGGRPRWRISEADLAAFEQRRTAVKPTQSRRRKAEGKVIQFF